MLKNRFAPTAPSKDSYEFVTIPSHKPARVKFNQYSAEVFVNFEPVVVEKGSRTQTLNYRATSKALLREQIEAKHPTACFTTAGANVEDITSSAKAALKQLRQENQVVSARDLEQARNRLLRVYGHSEITLDKALREGISEPVFNALYRQEAQKFAAMVTNEHRKLAEELSEQEHRELTLANITMFADKSDWASWFKQFDGNFFSYCDYSNANLNTLLKYCAARGWTVPLLGELDAAHRYLLAHSHYYLQHAYPRTQRDAYRAVRPFVSIEPDVVPTDERQQALAATKGLSARQLKENMASIRNQNLSDDELRRRGRLLR